MHFKVRKGISILVNMITQNKVFILIFIFQINSNLTNYTHIQLLFKIDEQGGNTNKSCT